MFMMKGKINTYTCVTKVGTMRERIEERGVENSKLWLQNRKMLLAVSK